MQQRLARFCFAAAFASPKLRYAARAMATSGQATCSGKALIFLHGLGDTPAGWSSLERQLPSLIGNLEGAKYVFPAAPTIPISINGGAEMPGWFDVLDWPIGITARDDRKGLLAAVNQIEKEVETLGEKGIAPSDIVVGGFSQGGAVALLAAYHQRQNKVPFAGCVVLSSWLTLEEDLSVAELVKQQTPLFWAHGQYDDKVLFEQQSHGVQKLLDLGVDVQHSSYPMGHSSHPQETAAMAAFIEKCLSSN